MTWLIILGVALLVFFLGAALTGAPYVPSKKTDLAVALSELYPIGPSDFLIDIGAGDGVVLRQAAKHGAGGLGYEINPFLVLVAWWLSRRYKNIKYQWANLWQVRFPAETTVVYVFGESRDIRRMAAKVQRESTRLQRPLHLITYGAEVPDMIPISKHRAHQLYRLEPLQA